MIVWSRFAVSLMFLMPLMIMKNRVAFAQPPYLPLQVLQALLLVAATLGFYAGLKTLPMADALASHWCSAQCRAFDDGLLLELGSSARCWLSVLNLVLFPRAPAMFWWRLSPSLTTTCCLARLQAMADIGRMLVFQTIVEPW